MFRKVQEFSLLLIGLFVSGMIFYSMSSILPQTTTYVFDSNAIHLGLIQLPNFFGQWIRCLIAAFMHKIKYVRWHLVTALAIHHGSVFYHT